MQGKNYDDIIDLPRPVSLNYPKMSRIDRAAQFAPFAALTGYEAAIDETGRLTDEKIELDEQSCAILDEKLRLLQQYPQQAGMVCITFFVQDAKKAGGAYLECVGTIRKIDETTRKIVMQDDMLIPLGDVTDIRCDLFARLEGEF